MLDLVVHFRSLQEVEIVPVHYGM